MSENSPLVSIIMGVHIDEGTLSSSIKSILNQSYNNFEFIIVNDGNDKEVTRVVNRIDDPRITLINQEKIGLTACLNIGIENSNGIFIARQDAGDFSQKRRLQTQVDYMLKHPSIALCGTFVNEKAENGHDLGITTFPTENTEIKNLLGFRGSYISDLFFQSIGLISYVFSITLIFTGINITFSKDVFLIIESIFYSIIYSALGSSFFNNFYDSTFALFINGNGGFIGNYLNENLFDNLITLNETISYYLLIVLITSFFLFSVNFNLKKFLNLLKKISLLLTKKNQNYTDKSELINKYIPQEEIKKGSIHSSEPVDSSIQGENIEQKTDDKVERAIQARMKGYEGEACGDCGNFTLVRNGTCLKCDTCGSTSGCS